MTDVPEAYGRSYWNPKSGQRWEGQPWRCMCCGSPDVVSIAPAELAAYAIARNAAGEQDHRLGRIMVRRPIPERAWCRDHWQERFGSLA